MKTFKQLIYFAWAFAFIKGYFGSKLGTAHALNEAIPILVIALFLTMLYWFSKIFIRTSTPELKELETEAFDHERVSDESIKITTPHIKEEPSQNSCPDKLPSDHEEIINMDLVEKLKGKPRCDFTSSFQVCEICETTKTGQTLNGHYVCGSCKQNYI